MRLIIITIILFCFCAGFATAEMYKWRDGNGKLHFSDKPFPERSSEVYTPTDINTIKTNSPTRTKKTNWKAKAQSYIIEQEYANKKRAKKEVKEKREAARQERLDRLEDEKFYDKVRGLRLPIKRFRR